MSHLRRQESELKHVGDRQIAVLNLKFASGLQANALSHEVNPYARNRRRGPSLYVQRNGSKSQRFFQSLSLPSELVGAVSVTQRVWPSLGEMDPCPHSVINLP